MRRNQTGKIALCGLLAAAAAVIMLLGGLIPMSTYVCPLLASLLCSIVFRICGSRLGLIWYAAVSILALMTGPDKEAAFVFLLLGYYPILKPRIDRSPLRVLWKILLFNFSVLLLCFLLRLVMGLDFYGDLEAASWILTLILLLLGNLVFFMLDRLLSIMGKRTHTRRNNG